MLKPGRHKLIGGARRWQGLLVAKGNPLHLHSLAEVAALRARFVHRQAGSGTRLLLEHLCQQARVAPAQLVGHGLPDEDSHLAVAAAVACGAGDAGLGIAAAASQFGLDFVPLVQEDYFLVCLRDALEQPPVQLLRQVLRGQAWRDTVAAVSYTHLNARCLIALALMTGQIGRPGTGLHPLRGQNNVQGASDAGLIPMMYPDYQSVEDPLARQRWATLWGVPAQRLAAHKGLTVVEVMHAIRAGRIRGLYIMGENPAMSDPDAHPVSYTHLDVYKRQALCCRNGPVGTADPGAQPGDAVLGARDRRRRRPGLRGARPPRSPRVAPLFGQRART